MCLGCIWQNVQGIPLCILPYYLAKARAKAADKMGIPKSSFGYNLWVSLAPGLAINQIHREMLIRGVHPKANPQGPVLTSPPEGQEMDRGGVAHA